VYRQLSFAKKRKTKQFFFKKSTAHVVDLYTYMYMATCTNDSNSKIHASTVITRNTLHDTIGDHFLVDVVLPFVPRAPGGPAAAFDSKPKDRSVLSVQSPNKVRQQLVPDKLAREKKNYPIGINIACRAPPRRHLVPIATDSCSNCSLGCCFLFFPLGLGGGFFFSSSSSSLLARVGEENGQAPRPRRRLADDGSVPTSPRRRCPAGRAAKSWQKKNMRERDGQEDSSRSRLIASTFQLLAAAQTRPCRSVNYYILLDFNQGATNKKEPRE
jgi:hypothetical protein